MRDRYRHLQWIPCKEALPWESPWLTRVLVTVRKRIEESYIDTVAEVDVSFKAYTGEPVFTYNGAILSNEHGYEILAWSPLPEPYKPED